MRTVRDSLGCFQPDNPYAWRLNTGRDSAVLNGRNLPPKITERKLRMAFARYGKVNEITLNEQQSETNPYGFCFVEMPFDNQASRAISELQGKKLSGNVLNIKESGLALKFRPR